jgi:sulfite exporter TauE/SafE
MFELITAGIALGLLGSFHCVGMCGPLALSLPINSDNMATKFFGALLYNAGRVVTYSFLGLLFGIIGRSFALFGFQQWLSIIMGSLILLYLLLGKRFNSSAFSIPGVSTYFTKLRKSIGALYMKRNFSALFFIGLLNGLLPCGMVYMAIAGGMACGNITGSMIFMGAFGLGTLPVMWAIAFFGNYLSLVARIKIRKAYPFVIALVACLLILRGMGLGIPYVSPALSNNKKEMLECGKS